MAGIEINDAEILAGLAELARRVTDMSPAMENIAEVGVATTKARFPAGVSPDGNQWAPKSPATIARYQSRGDTADLRPLFGPSGRLHSEISGGAGADFAEWGTNAIYGAVMQFGAGSGEFGQAANGSKIPWGDIPARPFLGLSDDDQPTMMLVIYEWIGGAWADD